MATNEARSAGLPVQVRSALGGGGWQPRKVLIWEGAIGLLLLVLMLLAKHVISARELGANPLAALPGGKQVAAGLDIGGVPTDVDLTGLAGSYNVDGVVNLTGPKFGEQATCVYLHVSYMQLAVASDAAPTPTQLHTLATFMRSNTSKGDYVYLHDDGGGGIAVSTASMLLIMKGESWQAVQKDLTSGELASLSSGQKRAIAQLTAALAAQGHFLPGNPYAGARIYRW
jgi:hypothetical protein